MRNMVYNVDMVVARTTPDVKSDVREETQMDILIAISVLGSLAALVKVS